MFKRTISFKLTLSFVIIALISMLTIGIIFINMFRLYTFESHQKSMLTKAHSIAETYSQYSEQNGPMRGFGGLMRSLNTLAEANVWITDSKGTPFDIAGMRMGMGMGMNNQFFESGPLPQEAQNVIDRVLSGNESVSQSFSSLYDEATVTVGVPVLSPENKIIGTVLLHSPVTGITETLNKSINILLISLLAALLLSMCLGIFYSLLFTRPLKVMNNTALEMSNGNYSVRTGVKREDEIGQLGKSLDLLASKLNMSVDQLYQEKGKMNDMISSIAEGIIAFDLALNLISINSSLSVIMHHGLPYPTDNIKSDFISLGINAEIKKVINNKEIIHVLKDWDGKKLRFTMSPILDSNNDVTGVVVLVSDISESERLEQLRKDFVANVSHEFRTPLTVIRGSIEGILDGAVNDQEAIDDYHRKMFNEVKSLERLVGDLLDLSRLQSGNISIKNDKIYIPEVLTDSIKSVQTIASKKNIYIDYNIPKDLPPVLGDYDRLRQLFVIFLDNAVKYSPDKTMVSIDIALSETMDITIKDQGCGISMEELPKIWGRFYKSDKSRNSNGTGLGLAIAQELADLHGASLSIESELGKGTVIKVTFPIYYTL